MGTNTLDWMLDTVEYVSSEVRPLIGKPGAGRPISTGYDVKGETKKQIDYVAEEAYKECIPQLGIPGLFVTEDSGIVRFGKGKPEILLQVDPDDGTYNSIRGLARCGTAIVGTRNLSNPIFHNIELAVVYDFAWKRGLYADHTGAYSYPENERVHPSNVESLKEASLSFRIGYGFLQEALYFFDVLKEGSLIPKQIRSEDVTVLEFSAVANGSHDAFVELRRSFKSGVLGPWDIAAPYKINTEAGCWTTDLEGNKFDEVSLLNLKKCPNPVSASTQKLHHETLEMSINALARQYADIKGYPDGLEDWLWFRKFMTGKTTLDVWRNREREIMEVLPIAYTHSPSVAYFFTRKIDGYLKENPERLAEMVAGPPKSSTWKNMLINNLTGSYVSEMFGPESLERKLELQLKEAELLRSDPHNWLEKFLKIYKP